MAHNPLDKIHTLDEIEKEIILCLQSAGKLDSLLKVNVNVYRFLVTQGRRYKN